jgi:NADH-quinone oxidoreductase subunit N
LPVAAYLSTASKFGGVVALAYVSVEAVPFERDVAVAALVVLALLSMTVGNLVALRQRRMVRLLAWSSIAQAGYILAALAVPDAGATALTYAVFFVALELAAFAAVVALRTPAPATVDAVEREPVGAGVASGAAPGAAPPAPVAATPPAPAATVGQGDDGGTLADYAGAARGAPWRTAAMVLALAGLAGLPPGIAGLFAKVAVVRGLVDANATWLAVVVAVNAVIGLAYYVRAGAGLFAPGRRGTAARWPRPHWTVAVTVGLIAVVALAIGFAPQIVFDAAAVP